MSDITIKDIKDIKDTIIRMTRCHFIDLLDKLEHYDFDFVDLSAFKNYVFMAPLNDYKYMIYSISNTKETYTLQYCQKYKKNKTIEESNIDNVVDNVVLTNIPYGTFNPTNLYDFEINLTKKTFNLINEYVIIDIQDYISKNINNDIQNNKKRNKLFHLLGC
jgi:hypothetical protein